MRSASPRSQPGRTSGQREASHPVWDPDWRLEPAGVGRFLMGTGRVVVWPLGADIRGAPQGAPCRRGVLLGLVVGSCDCAVFLAQVCGSCCVSRLRVVVGVTSWIRHRSLSRGTQRDRQCTPCTGVWEYSLAQHAATCNTIPSGQPPAAPCSLLRGC